MNPVAQEYIMFNGTVRIHDRALTKPCADMSRGSTEDDILAVAAILGLQAIEYRKLYPSETTT